jgi:hypothetical protein
MDQQRHRGPQVNSRLTAEHVTARALLDATSFDDAAP